MSILQQLKTLPLWGLCLLLAGLGAVAGFGHAPYYFPIVTVAALAVSLWLLDQREGRGRAFAGWSLGFGYFAHVMFWITEPFMVDAAATGWMAVPALGLMAGGLALFWGAGAFFGRGTWGLVAGLALAELARSYVFTGLPWALVGYVWIDAPFYQWAAWIGPHGVTFLTFGLAGLMFWRGFWTFALAVILLPTASHMPFPDQAKMPSDAPIIRIVHPDILQKDKWHPDTLDANYQLLLDLTAKPGDVDLIVWPEASLTMSYALVRDDLRQAARNVPLLLGRQYSDDFTTYYNAATLVGPQDASYFKSRLVPFGEYLPFGSFLSKIGLSGLADARGAGFTAGPGPATLAVPGIGYVQPLTCYEGIFPQFVGATQKRARALVLMTNDGWFGTGSGPIQHFAQARARAIEQGLPVIRSANRGISGVIDAQGHVMAAKGLGQAGIIDAALPPAAPATLYSRTKDWPAGFIILAVVAFAFWRHRPT